MPARAPAFWALIESAIACTTALAATGAQSNCEPDCGAVQLSDPAGVTGSSQEPVAFAKLNNVSAEVSSLTPEK